MSEHPSDPSDRPDHRDQSDHPDRPYRVTVVCWGNICRSPMGEFLLREAFEDAGLGDQVVVASAGTSAEETGNGMHPRTAAVLKRNGHPDTGFAEHRARRFDASWFDHADLVLPTDHIHVDRLEQLARDERDIEKVRLFRSFDPDAVASGELGMEDPWYGTDPAYDQTYTEIRAAVPGIVDHVRAQLNRR